jgi:heme oxygenase
MCEEIIPLTRARKEKTRDLHEVVEHHPFQQELLKGSLPRERYVAFLGEMHAIHTTLDAALATHGETSKVLRRVLANYSSQKPFLEDDLAFFGQEAASLIERTKLAGMKPAAEGFSQRLMRTLSENPIGLLGFLYVLEGSRNGGRVIARCVRNAYPLSDGRGTAFLDPYGENQRERWQRFKGSLDNLVLSETDRAGVVEGARVAFLGMNELSHALTNHRHKTL